MCIKGPVTVTIDATSGRVDLASLVLAGGATVRVSAGAGLFVWKDDEADFSLVRADSAIHVSGGTLGGPGKLLVRGLVTLAPEGGQPATLGTSDGAGRPASPAGDWCSTTKDGSGSKARFPTFRPAG